MNLQSALKSQYHAGLKTLRLAIETCPAEMWNDPADKYATFSRVVYHALFFTDMYLQQDEASFKPWEKHREDADCLDFVSWENGRLPATTTPYTKEELLAYWQICDGMVDAAVDGHDYSRTECGFPWYRVSKLEHQFVNLRHIQHHAAALSTRLRRQAGIEVPWVARG